MQVMNGLTSKHLEVLSDLSLAKFVSFDAQEGPISHSYKLDLLFGS